jgi:anti-sigma B factor antagonist
MAGQIEILEFRERFDAHAAHEAARALEAAIARTSRAIVINLQAVDFIDSSAMATLVRAMKRARERGGDLYLCSLQPSVRIIFELTRLDKAFTIFPSEAAATAALATQ